MTDNQKKRKLSTGSATAFSAKKRRKAPTTKKAGPKAAAKPKKVLDANSLQWKTVDIPEMFDDAEGFFGLEEVTGVEVVRNGNTIKFVSTLVPLGILPSSLWLMTFTRRSLPQTLKTMAKNSKDSKTSPQHRMNLQHTKTKSN